MYSAKSLEFIGDFCDSAIFRILRSVASLWNWLKNVMTHNHFVSTINLLKRTVNKNCLLVFVFGICVFSNKQAMKVKIANDLFKPDVLT